MARSVSERGARYHYNFPTFIDIYTRVSSGPCVSVPPASGGGRGREREKRKRVGSKSVWKEKHKPRIYLLNRIRMRSR